MKQQPRFEWTEAPDGGYNCHVTVDGQEVYAAYGRFPAGGPAENARTRIAYEREIWEEYTGVFVA